MKSGHIGPTTIREKWGKKKNRKKKLEMSIQSLLETKRNEERKNSPSSKKGTHVAAKLYTFLSHGVSNGRKTLRRGAYVSIKATIDEVVSN